MPAFPNLADRLHTAVATVCPIIGVSIGQTGVSASVRIDFDPSATPAQQAAAQAVVNGFDWSQSAQDAADNLTARTEALANLGTAGSPTAKSIAQQNKLLRAVVLLAMDEINLLRQRDVDRAADVAAATSLTDLKARWAARSALAQRTVAQLRTALQDKINSGDADS